MNISASFYLRNPTRRFKHIFSCRFKTVRCLSIRVGVIDQRSARSMDEGAGERVSEGACKNLAEFGLRAPRARARAWRRTRDLPRACAALVSQLSCSPHISPLPPDRRTDRRTRTRSCTLGTGKSRHHGTRRPRNAIEGRSQ